MPLPRRLQQHCLSALAGLLLPISVMANPQGTPLGPEAASKAVAAAQHTSTLRADNVAISIVDTGGHLLYFTRPDRVPSGMGDAATKKAQTAAAYGFSTQVLEEAVAKGNTSYLALPGILPLRGGLPVMANGQVIGAIGVAGSDSDNDAAMAQAILSALPQ